MHGQWTLDARCGRTYMRLISPTYFAKFADIHTEKNVTSKDSFRVYSRNLKIINLRRMNDVELLHKRIYHNVSCVVITQFFL